MIDTTNPPGNEIEGAGFLAALLERDEPKNSKSPFAATNLSPFPLPRATIAPPEGEVKRPARAIPLGGAQQAASRRDPCPR